MNGRSLHSMLLILLCLAIAPAGAQAQPDPIEHTWYNEAKTGKVHIYKAVDGKFYGKLVWLKEPDRDGKPKLDINNPDKAKRNQPTLGLVLLRGFKKINPHLYDDGTIYDPKNGKTYDCTIKLNGDKLEVRGYIMISLIGRSETWTIAEQ